MNEAGGPKSEAGKIIIIIDHVPFHRTVIVLHTSDFRLLYYTFAFHLDFVDTIFRFQ